MKTALIIRFGGLVPTFFQKKGVHTCMPSEARVFKSRKVAIALAYKLQRDYTCGVRAVDYQTA